MQETKILGNIKSKHRKSLRSDTRVSRQQLSEDLQYRLYRQDDVQQRVFFLLFLLRNPDKEGDITSQTFDVKAR